MNNTYTTRRKRLGLSYQKIKYLLIAEIEIICRKSYLQNLRYYYSICKITKIRICNHNSGENTDIIKGKGQAINKNRRSFGFTQDRYCPLKRKKSPPVFRWGFRLAVAFGGLLSGDPGAAFKGLFELVDQIANGFLFDLTLLQLSDEEKQFHSLAPCFLRSAITFL